jgi:G3E family GTPase
MASELADKLRLDGIITVVDARHLDKELSDGPEAHAQIAFADVILINKTDLVTPSELSALEKRIGSMNSLAAIHHTRNSVIDPAKILNVKARELLTPFPTHTTEQEHHHHDHDHDHKCGEHCDHDHEHHEHHDHGHGHGHENEDVPHHHHDDKVSSFYIEEDRQLDMKKLETWLSGLLKDLGVDIYRSKGVLNIKGQAKRVVFQGVQMLFDSTTDRFWNTDEKRRSQLVFIGRELDEAKIREGFLKCLAE